MLDSEFHFYVLFRKNKSYDMEVTLGDQFPWQRQQKHVNKQKSHDCSQSFTNMSTHAHTPPQFQLALTDIELKTCGQEAVSLFQIWYDTFGKIHILVAESNCQYRNTSQSGVRLIQLPFCRATSGL